MMSDRDNEQPIEAEIIEEKVKEEYRAKTPPPPPKQPVGTASFDPLELFSLAFSTWKNNLISVVLASAVYCVVFWIPVVNVAFTAGYTRFLLKTIRGEQTAIADIFKAWDCFISLFIYTIILIVAHMILGVIPAVGFLLSMALTVITTAGFVAVAENRMTAIDAFKYSYAAFKGDMMGWGFAVLVGGFISGLGAILFGIGIVLTVPLGALLMLHQYQRQQGVWS